MKYASVEHCPVYGGKVKSYDSKDALSVAGVERVVEIPATPMPSGFNPLGGIAVIAGNTWSAQQGRQHLKIEWDYGPNAGRDSATYRAELEATAKEPGKVVRDHGDVDGGLASAAKRVDRIAWRVSSAARPTWSSDLRLANGPASRMGRVSPMAGCAASLVQFPSPNPPLRP